MKQVIEDLANKYGLETAYSGATRILYVKGEKNKDFIAAIHERYPDLAFELKAVDTFEKPNQESFKEIHALPLSKEDAAIEEDIIAEEKEEKQAKQISKEELREEIDEYLLNNPIDKSQKGFFVPIAKKFEVTSDYIRKRYNSLKEKGLIEKQIVNA